MATYMYTSATGSNWDDDEDFDLSVYTAASESFGTSTKDDLAQHHHLPAVQESDESKPASDESTIDFDSDPDFWPTYAQKITQSWYFPSSRPAFPELSHDDEYSYPDERVQYHANWTAAKLRVGANMRHPLMMKPSPLRLSKNWVRDGHAEFVKDDGFSFSQVPVPSPLLNMVYDSSEEEQDEAKTPPGSPPIVQDLNCEKQVEEYDPVADAIATPKHDVDAMYLTHDFTGFSSISEDLDVADVLGDAVCSMQHDCIGQPFDATPISMSHSLPTDGVKTTPALTKEPPESPQLLAIDTPHHIEAAKKAKPTAELTWTTVVANYITSPLSNSLEPRSSVDSKISENHGSQVSDTLEDSKPLWSAASESPDLKYIHDPTNTSLVLNTVAAGWFVLSSIPWGRIAVAAAGALVDVVTLVARC